ncbi:MAG: hypothetical protein JSR76_04120 [Verrucomicrobia bacterium]|nr:hypothetical protein [Verrucomicrobiota bacterium]
MQDTAYIYGGPGASLQSISQTIASLKNFFPIDKIKKLSPKQLLEASWEKDAALFVLPGGLDLPYAKILKGARLEKIRSYVEEGGLYIGICAGAYYSSAFVDFAKGEPLEIQEARKLAFFKGTAKGPILAPWVPQSEEGARCARILWGDNKGFPKGKEFFVYYNGGSYFVEAEKSPGIEVLAYYDLKAPFPAIIACSIGKGRAILSGVHFEYDPLLLDGKNLFLQALLPGLTEGNRDRLSLCNYIYNL